MWRRGFQVAAVYVGAVVGAGFASGQEIMQFFGVHSAHAVPVSVFVACSFGLMGLLVIAVCAARSISDYGGLARFVLGNRLGAWYDCFLSVCLLAGLAIMLAGAGALVEQEVRIAARVGAVATAAVIYVVLLYRLVGAVAANVVLVPVLLVIIVITCAGVPEADHVPVFVRLAMATGDHWTESAVLYVMYNMQLAVAVLAPLAASRVYVSGWITGIIVGGTVLGLLVGLMVTGMSRGLVSHAEVPMTVLAHKVGGVWGAVYGVALWCALLTTGIAAAVGLLTRLGRKVSSAVGALVILVPALIIAEAGFSSLVGVVYPVMGYLSLPLMTCLVMRFICSAIRGIRVL